MEADMADGALAGELDGEAGLRRRPVGPPGANPGFGIAQPVGIGHAREVAGDREIIEITRYVGGVAEQRRAQQQAWGVEGHVHRGWSTL
jgi:hypothetical protein